MKGLLTCKAKKQKKSKQVREACMRENVHFKTEKQKCNFKNLYFSYCLLLLFTVKQQHLKQEAIIVVS